MAPTHPTWMYRTSGLSFLELSLISVCMQAAAAGCIVFSWAEDGSVGKEKSAVFFQGQENGCEVRTKLDFGGAPALY